MHLGSVAELQKWMAMSDREAVEQYGMGRHGKVVERCGDAVWREEMESDVEVRLRARDLGWFILGE